MTDADHLTSPLLRDAGFRHAFFTRRGGVSEGPFASLNFSAGVGDAPERVRENLRRAAAALELDAAHVYFASQVHGTSIRRVEPRDDREAVLACEADAIVANAPGVACAVRSADCVPILLADRASGAVAAVHAGWRGVVRRVLESGVQGLRELIASEGELVAAIGPHLSVRHFEVSPDVAEELRAASPDPDVVDRSRARPHVDLRRIVRAQLRELGLRDSAIDDVPGCTFGDVERFFSYRRDGQVSGRLLSAIATRSY
jgi:polyphenol oxidase